MLRACGAMAPPRIWPALGGAGYRPSALGHPRVYLQIDEKGYVDCGYCDRRFVLAGGPADRGLHEASSGDLPPEEA